MKPVQLTLEYTQERVVTDTIRQDLTLPYYGRDQKARSYVSVEAVMWPHLPQRIQHLRVVELRSTGERTSVKEHVIKVPSTTLTFESKSTADLLKRYDRTVSEKDFKAKLATIIQQF